MSAAFWFMIAVLGAAGIAFLTVVIWVTERTKEREAHYRSETVRKFAESGNSDAAMEYLKALDTAEASRVRLKSRIAGLINFGVGVAFMVAMHQVATGTAVYLFGLIPLLIGVALLIASELMMKPKS